MKYEQFKDKINKNSTEIIDINLKIYQKFYIQYLFEEGKINNFTEASEYFKKKFPKAEFKLKEDNIKKIKKNIYGKTNNLSIEEICKSLKNNKS